MRKTRLIQRVDFLKHGLLTHIRSAFRIVETKVKVESVAWWMLVLAFILGLLVMYILKYLPLSTFKRKKSPFKESEALKVLYAHTSESKEVEDMVRQLYAKKNGDKSVIIDKKVLKDIVEKYV